MQELRFFNGSARPLLVTGELPGLVVPLVRAQRRFPWNRPFPVIVALRWLLWSSPAAAAAGRGVLPAAADRNDSGTVAGWLRRVIPAGTRPAPLELLRTILLQEVPASVQAHHRRADGPEQPGRRADVVADQGDPVEA